MHPEEGRSLREIERLHGSSLSQAGDQCYAANGARRLEDSRILGRNRRFNRCVAGGRLGDFSCFQMDSRSDDEQKKGETPGHHEQAIEL